MYGRMACLLDVCQPVSDVASRRHLRSAGRRLQNVPHQRRTTFARRAFSVAGPLVWNSLPDYLRDPAVSRDTFCKHLKTFFVCSVLIYVQRIRAYTTMRYICLCFTYYLLTYLLPLLRNCAKFLPFYPSKFFIQIRSTFSVRFALNSFSARHQNCYLIPDIYFAIQTYLLWTSRPWH